MSLADIDLEPTKVQLPYTNLSFNSAFIPDELDLSIDAPLLTDAFALDIFDITSIETKEEKKQIAPPRQGKTIAPTVAGIAIPEVIDDVKQCVVNALAMILPVDARVMVFGFWHAIVLVGVFYRHNNLCWIVLNRVNQKLYLLCHLVADAIHLCEGMRKTLQPSAQLARKWNRQGVPEVTCLFRTLTDFINRTGDRLTELPKEVLKFTRSKHCLQRVTEFLRFTGTAGRFLQRYIRAQKPLYFSAVLHGLTEHTRGWKIFNSGSCKKGKRRHCCEVHKKLLDTTVFCEETLKQQIMHIFWVIPSRLDFPENQPLREHFRDFIQWTRDYPEWMFFPDGSVHAYI
jgi:hypothetical protein